MSGTDFREYPSLGRVEEAVRLFKLDRDEGTKSIFRKAKRPADCNKDIELTVWMCIGEDTTMLTNIGWMLDELNKWNDLE